MNTDHIIINKIKYKDGRVVLNYIDEKKEGQNKYQLDSFEKPNPHFIEALKNLAKHVVDICELPEDYQDRLEVIGVSFSHTNDIMGATITALMRLAHSNAPLVLNTPHKHESPYSEGADEENCLDWDCITALESVIAEAKLFIAGERAQLGLFENAA